MSPDTDTLNALRIDRGSVRRRGVPIWLVVLLLLVGLGGGAAWWFHRPVPLRVRTVAVQAGTAAGDQTLLNASGYVTARREATVSSKITAKVVEVLVEEGMEVEADQILARLDDANVRSSLRLAEAQLESARKALGETQANLEHAERELRRIGKLRAENSASQVELDRADTDAKGLRARLDKQQVEIEVARREVELWQQQVDDTIIRAPFAGVVTSKNAQPGEMISPMSAGGGFTRTGICTLVDMASLEIEVDVGESYINRVRSGQPVVTTLDSYPSWRIPAKVIAIIPTADRQKATVKVRVGFEQLDPRILPDMSVKVAFQGGEQAANLAQEFTLPKAAVRRDNGRDIVWIVRDGRLERRAVTVGAERGDQVALAAGVRAGDRVVLDGPADLADGAEVTEIQNGQ